jgi:hypothetical protein
LTGDKDGTADINWKTLTATTDFGDKYGNYKRNTKYCHNGRITMRTTGDVYVKAITDEETSRAELVTEGDGRLGMHARRVKIPLGLKGTVWQFETSGTGATTVGAFEVEPIASKRTKG